MDRVYQFQMKIEAVHTKVNSQQPNLYKAMVSIVFLFRMCSYLHCSINFESKTKCNKLLISLIIWF
jgi:hypothetical protein